MATEHALYFGTRIGYFFSLSSADLSEKWQTEVRKEPRPDLPAEEIDDVLHQPSAVGDGAVEKFVFVPTVEGYFYQNTGKEIVTE